MLFGCRWFRLGLLVPRAPAQPALEKRCSRAGSTGFGKGPRHWLRRRARSTRVENTSPMSRPAASRARGVSEVSVRPGATLLSRNTGTPSRTIEHVVGQFTGGEETGGPCGVAGLVVVDPRGGTDLDGWQRAVLAAPTRRHRRRIQPLGQRHPDEEPARGPGPGAAVGHLPFQGGEHGAASGAVHVPEGPDLAVPVAVLQVVADRELGEHRRAQRRRLLGQHPDGLLKFGIGYGNLTRLPCFFRCSAVSVRALGISPSESQATCTTSV